jgi:hypothetical protein
MEFDPFRHPVARPNACSTSAEAKLRINRYPHAHFVAAPQGAHLARTPCGRFSDEPGIHLDAIRTPTAARARAGRVRADDLGAIPHKALMERTPQFD